MGLAIVGVVSASFGLTWDDAIISSAIFGLLSLSVIVVTGYAGQISLAQYALAGIGALAAGRLMAAWHVPFLAALILSYLPVGQAAFNRLSPTEQQASSDLGSLILTLGLDLALAMAFGALIGWLGAWSLLRFRPPREPAP